MHPESFWGDVGKVRQRRSCFRSEPALFAEGAWFGASWLGGHVWASWTLLPRSRPNARRRTQLGVVAAARSELGSPNTKPAETPPPPPPPVTPSPSPVLLEFEQAAYRKELSQVLRELNQGCNIGALVRRIRIQNVPIEKQAQEFTDIMTRACEEHRGVVRRLSFAFAVGLANGAFEREECAFGLMSFFEDVFEDLASEVPRLRNRIANEFVPTLRTSSVFSEEDIGKLIPADCHSVLA